MAAAAQQARRPAAVPRRDVERDDERLRAVAYRAPRSRRRAAQRSRLMRAFIVFVVCLTVLAVGRVALSFAVVQKSIQTDALVREERRLTAENARLEEDFAQLGSTVRIRHIAETQLGLVDASHVRYLRAGRSGSVAEVAENR